MRPPVNITDAEAALSARDKPENITKTKWRYEIILSAHKLYRMVIS